MSTFSIVCRTLHRPNLSCYVFTEDAHADTYAPLSGRTCEPKTLFRGYPRTPSPARMDTWHAQRGEGGGRRHEFFSRFLGFILSIFFFIFLSFIQFLKYVYKLCTRMHTLYTYIRTMYTCIFFCFSIRTYINFDVYAIYPCIQSLYVFIYSIYIHIRRREKNRGGQLAARARPARVSALPANAPRP